MRTFSADRWDSGNGRFGGLWIWVLALGCLGLGAGCQTVREHSLTHALWTSEELRRDCEPATDPNLSLFALEERDEVVVMYDETCENQPDLRRRSFLLYENWERIAAGKRPEFVDPGNLGYLQPIPFHRDDLPVADLLLHARHGNVRGSFTLHRNHLPEGPFYLPVYAGKSGLWRKVAYSPFAFAADSVVLGIGSGLPGFLLPLPPVFFPVYR
jgi:hypothetical protein